MYFGERMEINSAGEKVKKEGNVEIVFKIVCTHSKWANEQTLKMWGAVVLWTYSPANCAKGREIESPWRQN